MANNQKIQYFNPKAFAQQVLEDCKMGDIPDQLRLELEEQIGRRLAERVTATVINTFQERELILFEKVLADHPELDTMDALTVVASGIPDLQLKLLKSIQDLHDELTQDAENIQQAMDQRQQSEEIKL